MRQVQLRIRTLDRVPAQNVTQEGEHLAGWVQKHVQELSSRPAPVAVVVRPQRTDLLDLEPVARSGVALNRFLAGLTRSEARPAGPPRAVGVAGTFRFVRGVERDHAVPVLVAFVEWANCGWWLWQMLLDADGTPMPETEIVRSAFAGDPLPGGIGRWWSLGRRTDVQVHYRVPPTQSGMPTVESNLVH